MKNTTNTTLFKFQDNLFVIGTHITTSTNNVASKNASKVGHEFQGDDALHLTNFFIIIPNSRVALLFSFLFNTIYYSHKIHLVFVYTYVTVCTVHKVHILFSHMNEKHT